MGECRFTNATGQSTDPWCAEHNRSAILCLRRMRVERDEALAKLTQAQADADQAIAQAETERDGWKRWHGQMTEYAAERRRERDEARREAEVLRCRWRDDMERAHGVRPARIPFPWERGGDDG